MNGLEPHIDTRTMQMHYERFYGTYVDNLNKHLEGRIPTPDVSLEDILKTTDGQEPQFDPETRAMASAVFNHEFFFSSMRPSSRQIVIGLSGKLIQAINRDFGSFYEMQAKFINATTSIVGSGFVWLCQYPNKKLAIVPTTNNETPLTMGLKPLLCLDVWEHAYVLKYMENKEAYAREFFSVIDWVKVGDRLN